MSRLWLGLEVKERIRSKAFDGNPEHHCTSVGVHVHRYVSVHVCWCAVDMHAMCTRWCACVLVCCGHACHVHICCACVLVCCGHACHVHALVCMYVSGACVLVCCGHACHVHMYVSVHVHMYV